MMLRWPLFLGNVFIACTHAFAAAYGVWTGANGAIGTAFLMGMSLIATASALVFYEAGRLIQSKEEGK